MKSAVKHIYAPHFAVGNNVDVFGSLHKKTTLNVNFTDDTERMIFQWLSLNSYYIQFVKVSTVHKRNLVHNDQLSFEMSWHQWPWTFQWSLVNRRNAAWMGPLSSWIWSLENCPVEVLLRCFKGLMAWMWPGGSNWPLIMAASCQWVECCLNSRDVRFLCLRVSLQDFLSSNYSHSAISPCLIYLFRFLYRVFFFVWGVFS